MPKVDFYLISEQTLSASLPFVCRLLDKAYQQKCTVYIQLNNEAEAKILDDLLWTFRDDAFIPHSLVEQNSLLNAPILIGFQEGPKQSYDLLLNLTQEVLSFYHRFNRIIEIVPNEPQFKAICRAKFRQYKTDQCELITHDLTKPN